LVSGASHDGRALFAAAFVPLCTNCISDCAVYKISSSILGVAVKENLSEQRKLQLLC
jgi:hypothetical protein